MSTLDQTKAPILEALQEMKRNRLVPFDVPGHKRGKGNPDLTDFLGEKCLSVDVNSMKMLDNLCHPISVIKEAEELAADAFGAAHAFFMVGGTTSSVQSMVLSVCKQGDKIILEVPFHKMNRKMLELALSECRKNEVVVSGIVITEADDRFLQQYYGIKKRK